MGNVFTSEPNTVPNPRSHCHRFISQLKDCKEHLSLRLEDPYPINSVDICEEQEYALKKCLAHAVDKRNANVLYSSSSSRKQKIEANRALIPKIAPYS